MRLGTIHQLGDSRADWRFAQDGTNVEDWKFVVIVIGTGLLALVITAALKLAGAL